MIVFLDFQILIIVQMFVFNLLRNNPFDTDFSLIEFYTIGTKFEELEKLDEAI